MEVFEHHINGMNNKPKPYKKPKFPESDNMFLPKIFFSMLSVAQKNSGKTFNICKLFHHFERWPLKDPEDGEVVPIRVVWFSPTVTSANNTILETVTQLDLERDVVDEFEDHKLQERIDEVEAMRKEIDEYQQYLRTYKKWMKVGEHRLSFDELCLLEKHNFESPRDVFGDLKYKKVPCTFFVFDDLAGTKAFKNGRSVLNKFLIAHRHTSGGINVIFTTQNMRSIPPILRRNIDIYVLFKNMNKKHVIETLYEEVSGLLKLDEFEALYEHCINQDYGCLLVDNHPRCEPNARFKNGWEKVLELRTAQKTA